MEKEKMKIGTWKEYNVNMIKDDKMVDKVYWTITDKKGKEQNRFESKASFGQWVYRTGWNASKEDKIKVRKASKIKMKKSKVGRKHILQFLIKQFVPLVEVIMKGNLFKAKKLPVGTIKEYGGRKYKKIAERKWVAYIGPTQKKKTKDTMQSLANEGVKYYQIEQRIRAKFGGQLNTKKAKEEFATQLKESGVRTSKEIKAARLKVLSDTGKKWGKSKVRVSKPTELRKEELSKSINNSVTIHTIYSPSDIVQQRENMAKQKTEI